MLHIKTFVFNPFRENTYVVYDDTKECIVIDPGCSSPFEIKQLCEFIDENQLHFYMIVNTHGHIDHVVGNAPLIQRYNVKVAAGTDAKFDFSKAHEQSMLLGFPTDKVISAPDIDLEEGDEVKVGDEVLEVIATPGHARGSVSLYNAVEGVVFTGDVLFCQSIGRTDLAGGDYDVLCRSIKEKLFFLPEDTVVLCGHGETTTIADERDFNLYLDECDFC